MEGRFGWGMVVLGNRQEKGTPESGILIQKLTLIILLQARCLDSRLKKNPLPPYLSRQSRRRLFTCLFCSESTLILAQSCR